MPVTLYKREVECAMPARMIFAISMADVFVVVDEVEGPRRLQRLRDLSKFACLQATEHLAPNMRVVAGKHIDRLHNFATDELDQQPGVKVAGAIWHFLKEVTDSEYLELYEGSPVAKACELFMPMFEHLFDEPALLASSQKQGRRVLRKLQDRGYYV